MKNEINDLLVKMETGENCIGDTANEILGLVKNNQNKHRILKFIPLIRKAIHSYEREIGEVDANRVDLIVDSFLFGWNRRNENVIEVLEYFRTNYAYSK